MASPELAEKLAKRLQTESENGNVETTVTSAPPPAPIIPQKIVENPYVAKSEDSIDDLIFQALEKKEENNNNQVSPSPTPLSINTTTPTSDEMKSPTIDPRSPPPKVSLQELLDKERQMNEAAQQTTPTPKTPVMVISKGAFPRSESPRRQTFIKENEDGNELERKLAVQRAKKYTEELNLAKSIDPLDVLMHLPYKAPPPLPQSAPPPPPTSSIPSVIPSGAAATALTRSRESIEEEDRQKKENEETKAFEELEREVERLSKSPVPPPILSLPLPPPPSISPPLPPSSVSLPSPPSSPRPLSQPPPPPVLDEIPEEPTFKEETQILSTPSLEPIKEETPEMEVNKIPQSPPPPPPKPETPLAGRRNIQIPTPQLIEMIQKEDELRSPSTSRPQSPATVKSFVSPLGLMCDPLLSVEKSTPSVASPPPPPPPKKTSMNSPPPLPIDEKELSEKLERRTKILEGEQIPIKMNKKLSVYAEFSEFTRKQIQYFMDTFKKYDEDGDNFIDFMELKRMMEKLGEAQTHIALKELIKKVDEDQDGKISQREFLLIFRLAASGELSCSEVFKTLADSVDVSKEGVLGAANFFQAKIAEQTKLSKFEEEMKEEKEERLRQEEERKARRDQFLAKKSIFH